MKRLKKSTKRKKKKKKNERKVKVAEMAAETGAAPDFIKSVLREQFRKGPPGASAGNSQRSFYDDAMGFFHAVAWREEKWLWAVIAFEILLLATILMTKSRWNVQVFLFSLTSALVYL